MERGRREGGEKKRVKEDKERSKLKEVGRMNGGKEGHKGGKGRCV